MISPEQTNKMTKAILENEIQEYLKLQTRFTIQKNAMVKTRKEINEKLTEITRLKALPIRT